MHRPAAQFTERAADRGVELDVREFSEGTKTAADAADAVGCEVADEPVVVVTSGATG